MPKRPIPPRFERAVVLSAAVALHVSFFALLFSMSATRPAPHERPGTVAMLSVAMPPQDRGKAPPPALPSKVAATRIVAEAAFSDDPDATGQGAARGCAILADVTSALVDDPVAIAAVIATPVEHRSIADAVVIWNAGWSTAATDPDAPLAPARRALEQRLGATPDECLDEPVAGPRLVPIPNGERTMFVAIGSGNWTWRQLITEQAPDDASMVQPPPQTSKEWDWSGLFGGR